MTLKHFMLDLETLATGQDAAIASIGMVNFDPNGNKIGSYFYQRVDLVHSVSPGVIDPATVDWWLQQDEASRAELTREGRVPLEDVLGNLIEWVIGCSRYMAVRKVSLEELGSGSLLGRGTSVFVLDGDYRLWSNGPLFDERILREAYLRHGFRFPFHYKSSRDCRTMYALHKELGLPDRNRKKGYAACGNSTGIPHGESGTLSRDMFVKHNAVHDALRQTEDICHIMQELRRRVLNATQTGKRIYPL